MGGAGQLELFARSRNASVGSLALCEIALADGKIPEWVCLIPAGQKIHAADGREFANTDPAAIVVAFDETPVDLPIDWEHASELKAPDGDQAPAAGWISEMEVRDGAVWGKVSWTPSGQESLASRAYRYLSPAFIRNKAGKVLKIVSAALTNQPALDMLPALAREGSNQDPSQEKTMDPKLLALLGLVADATPEAILAAVTKMKTESLAAANLTAETAKKVADAEAALATARSTPPLDKFVPRADFDIALARAKTLEDEKVTSAKKAHDDAAAAEVDAALKAGKIVPASKDFYVSTCATVEGLAKFRDFVKTAPVIGDPSKLEGVKPPTTGDPAASDEALAIAKRCGVTKERYLEACKAA